MADEAVSGDIINFFDWKATILSVKQYNKKLRGCETGFRQLIIANDKQCMNVRKATMRVTMNNSVARVRQPAI